MRRLTVLLLGAAGAAQAQTCPTQTFDAVSAPALPAGWSVVNDSLPADSMPSFRFTTVGDLVDSAPNAAFIPDFVPVATVPPVGTINDVSLLSPAFVPAPGTVLRFDNRWNLRLNNYSSATPVRYDGGVLEISIDGAPFVDVLDAGGGFAQGGYFVGSSDTISTSTVGGVRSPIAGRRAWSGMSTSNGVVGSGGVFDAVTTVVDLPSAAIGRATRVRFRSVVSPMTSIALPPGTPGWWIDSLGCDTPPRLAQSFAPDDAPVGTPTTLTLTIEHTAGGAQLSADFVDTLPPGLSIAATPNATTTCVGGVVNATAGAGSFTLLAGASIPAGGCQLQVDVSAAAAGIFAHALSVGQLQTTLGSNPNVSTINFQATQAGVPTWRTSFEAGTGLPTPYPVGADTAAANLSGKDGWITNAGSGVLNNVRVQLPNARSGAQHARIDPQLPNGNGYQIVRSKQFLAGTTDYALAEASIAIQTEAGTNTPAPFDFAPLYVDRASGLPQPITRVRFAGAFTEPPNHATNPVVGVDPSILVEDALAGGFVDTHVDWSAGASYQDLRVVTRRSDAAILVCLDGAPIHIGQGASAELRSLQFSLQRQTGVSANHYDLDDVGIDNRNDGDCSDATGATRPVIAKRFSAATIEIDTPFTSTVTLKNWNAQDAVLSADLVDALPAQLEALDASTTCSGGALSHGTSAITLGSGARIPAQGECTVTATLRGIATGSASDGVAIDDLQTDAGGNATAPRATISVTEVLSPPTLETSFAPPAIAAGGTSTLRLTLRNPNFSPLLLSADLVDALPVGLTLSAPSTTCVGTATAVGGSLQLAAGARIPGDGGSCIVLATVGASAIGSYVNTLPAGALQTSGGANAVAASATLEVGSGVAPTVAFERTVGTDLSPGACGSDKVLTVSARTAVNFCYRLTNHSDRTLRFHSITSAYFGRVANFADAAIAPGQTHQVNDIRVMTQDVIDTATWQADDALVNYSHVRDPASLDWDDIRDSGALWSNSPGATIPFAFDFYGEPQSVVDMVDGGLGFGRAGFALPFANADLPTPFAEQGLAVMPWWDRWQASAGGSMYWQVKGVAPHRRLIAQWQDRKFNSTNPQGVRYQVVLFEHSGEIAFLYQQVDNGVTDPGSSQYQHSFGRSATIGLSFDAARAARVSYFPGEEGAVAPAPVINAGDSFLFTPSTRVRYADEDSVGVMVVSAQLQVDAGQMLVPVQQGSTASRSLTIGNVGSENLIWDVDPARTASAHLPPASPVWPERAVLGVDAETSSRLADPAPAPAGDAEVVPAYAFTLSASLRSLVEFDVEDPEVLSTVARFPVSGHPEFDVTGLEFAGPDFDTVYGLSYGTDDPDTNGVLHAFDTTTGEATWIGRMQANASGKNEVRSDLSWDPVEGKLYAITFYTVPHTLNLYTVDPATAQSTFVAKLHGAAANGTINAIGINGQGQMYGIDILNDRLVAIDKRTGETAVVGPLGYNATSDQSLEFDDRSDTLYWIGGAGPQSAPIYSVFTIDTTTGAATLVDGTGYFGSAPTAIGTSAFAIAANHPCALPSEIEWLQLSASEGVVGPSDSDSVQLSFDPQGLADGEHHALLCLASNDPETPRVRIPLTLSVSTVNRPPQPLVATLRRSFGAGQPVNLDLSLLFADPEGGALSYTMAGAPDGLTLDPQSGVLRGVPAPGSEAGSPYRITVTARDPQQAGASLTLELAVIGALFVDGFE